MDWFKVFTEARTDPKLGTLTLAQRGVWFNLMCLAGEQTPRGTIPPRKSKLLALDVACGDCGVLSETLDKLVDLDILSVQEDGALHFLNWDKRQHRKPSDQPEATAIRKRKQREKERGVTPTVTRSHAPVTPPEVEVDKEIEDGTKQREELNTKMGGVQALAQAHTNGHLRPVPKPSAAASPAAQLVQLVEDTAIRILDRKLTASERRAVTGWFNTNKSGLAPPIVEYAETETAAQGGNLAYFFRVMERVIEDPSREKPGTSSKKGKANGHNSGHKSAADSGVDYFDWLHGEPDQGVAGSDRLGLPGPASAPTERQGA